MSANQLKRTLLRTKAYKTAWYLCHRIRAAMAEAERPMLDGTVEMDETYVGGKQPGTRQGWPRDGTQRVVIGIRQRGGDRRFFHAEDAEGDAGKVHQREHQQRCGRDCH